MSSQADFIESNLAMLGFTSRKEIIENLYLRSLVNSYGRINKTASNENEIRDRFMLDLYEVESQIRQWIQLKVIYVNWENWVFTPSFELARTDISFKISGFEFIVECKRLKTASNKYFEEGLFRFISTKYGEGDEFAGMLGFIIDREDDKIVSALNLKSRDYHYEKSSFCSETYANWANSFLSTHCRPDASLIKIYHLFFHFAIAA